MDEELNKDLRQQFRDMMLDWFNKTHGEFTSTNGQEVLWMLEAAKVLESEATCALNEWVDLARKAGLSWVEIGLAINTTKQGAAKRFGKNAVTFSEEDAPCEEQIVMRSATLLNEINILRTEGKAGGELLAIAPLSLMFRKTNGPWEHTRIFSVNPKKAKEEQVPLGWTYVDSYGPLHYFKRRVDP